MIPGYADALDHGQAFDLLERSVRDPLPCGCPFTREHVAEAWTEERDVEVPQANPHAPPLLARSARLTVVVVRCDACDDETTHEI